MFPSVIINKWKACKVGDNTKKFPFLPFGVSLLLIGLGVYLLREMDRRLMRDEPGAYKILCVSCFCFVIALVIGIISFSIEIAMTLLMVALVFIGIYLMRTGAKRYDPSVLSTGTRIAFAMLCYSFAVALLVKLISL